jgi:hypothetical protein
MRRQKKWGDRRNEVTEEMRWQKKWGDRRYEETEETRLVRAVTGYRMMDHKRDKGIREELWIINRLINKIIKKNCRTKWLERLKNMPENRSCFVGLDINRTVEKTKRYGTWDLKYPRRWKFWITVFWLWHRVCSLVGAYQRSRGIYHLHLQSHFFLTWRWRSYLPLKH